MDYTTFRKAWDDSWLSKYYERMDDLHRLGFTFDAHRDMDYYESEALNQWLTDDRKIVDVPLVELEAAKHAIIAAAAILREGPYAPGWTPKPTNGLSASDAASCSPSFKL